MTTIRPTAAAKAPKSQGGKPAGSRRFLRRVVDPDPETCEPENREGQKGAAKHTEKADTHTLRSRRG
jgi:hypothetical protein